jgi:hypothetical protein
MQTVIDGVLKEASGQSVEQLAQAGNKLVWTFSRSAPRQAVHFPKT